MNIRLKDIKAQAYLEDIEGSVPDHYNKPVSQ